MNPYQILGVSESASDDEIKKAYRTLSRKYHPDANINNPNKEQAEEMFKQVQQAYDKIMKDRQNGYAGGYANTYTHRRYTYEQPFEDYTGQQNRQNRTYVNFGGSFCLDLLLLNMCCFCC